ncbi:MAG: M48 family metallopeptidase [Burkholderiales bacterium]|nr:M48 family metallopeptidase [Burkholderiales bacterium]MDQ3196866.1 M48 family metallopeptidase [Pseudomonadota bacterium]
MRDFRKLRHYAVVVVLSALLPACETAPVTGRNQLIVLPKSQEIQMGLQAYDEILKKEKISTDPQANALVQRVGKRIAAATGEDLPWEFKVIENDKVANAFALPGGKVAVYTGLLPITQTEAGLAAVIGHEVAHATARHGGERVSQNLIAQLGLAATAAAMSNRDPATVQSVIGLLGAGATVGVALPFGRSQESEADRIGMIYMAKAGYDPRAAKDLWLRMTAASEGKQRPPEFLSTHPAEATRIERIEKWLPEALAHYKPK